MTAAAGPATAGLGARRETRRLRESRNLQLRRSILDKQQQYARHGQQEDSGDSWVGQLGWGVSELELLGRRQPS